METVCMFVQCTFLHYVCTVLYCSSAAIKTDMNKCVYVHICVVIKWRSTQTEKSVALIGRTKVAPLAVRGLCVVMNERGSEQARDN